MRTKLMRVAAYFGVAGAAIVVVHLIVLAGISRGPNPEITPSEVYAQMILMAAEGGGR